jgi:hypothetical protein
MKRTVTALAISLLAACSTMSVQTAKDPSANLTGYRTFAWANEPAVGPTQPVSMLEQTVKSSIEKELAAKGLSPASGEAKPDLLVAYRASSRQEIGSTSYPSGAGYPGWGYPSGGYEYSYREGSLRIDLIDPKTNKVVWEGTAADAIKPTGANPKQVAEAVHAILERYPA